LEDLGRRFSVRWVSRISREMMMRSRDAADFLEPPRPNEIIGSTIGHYEVLGLAGLGGMGEVYRARDIKLGRDVALKLLPSRFSNEPERVDRFEREAKILASLNHPNIAAIYDLEESDGMQCLVLEFVEGESLADRLSKGPIPITDILNISRQIADALEATHEQGVVHRDLKPANVMITPKGVVKVLDFGIARLLEPTASPDSTGDSGTAGKVLGTPSYMSPEQARGTPVDKRTDIWAFGCVLYELITGRRAFQGKTITDTLAAILEHEPDWQAIPGNVPPPIQEIIRRCLHKDVRRRLRDIGDARIQIELSGREAAVSNLSGPRSRWMLSIAAGALVLVIAVLVSFRWLTLSSAAPFERIEITRLTDSGNASAAAISPDGKFVVHAVTEEGKSSLSIRQTATGSNLQIQPPAPGTFFYMKVSRDNNSLYYWFANLPFFRGTMYSIPVPGGTPRKQIYEKPTNSGSLSPDEKHFVLTRNNSPMESVLFTINVDGSGERQLLARNFPEALYGPALSPDGKTIAYGAISFGGGYSARLEAIPAEGGPAQRIGSRTWTYFGGAQWLPSGKGLVILAGQQEQLQVWHVSYPAGEARRITNDLSDYRTLSLNEDGSALVTVQTETRSALWVASADDSASARQITKGRQDINTNPTWTGDGKIIYSAPDYRRITQLWITATDGSAPQQLTTESSLTASPAVCGDGRLIYLSYRAGSPHIWRSNLDGSVARPLTNGDGEFAPSCSPDGTWLTYSAHGNNEGVWRMPIDGGEPVRIWEHYGLSQISPDGKWVLIQDFLTRKAVIVPAAGGPPIKTFDLDPDWGWPRQWASDSRGFFYVRTSNGISNVWQRSLDGEETKQVTNFDSDQINTQFGVVLSRDGKQLAVVRGSTTSDIVMIKDLNSMQK